jgi:ankyrin repeat protein
VYVRKFEAAPLLVAATPPARLGRPLLTAAVHGNVELMRQILARLPEPLPVITADEERLAGVLLTVSDKELAIFEEIGLPLPLWAAARFGRLERMKELLAAGANVNQPPPHSHRETPLFLAVNAGHLEAVKLLLQYKADPNRPSENDTYPSPLHEAVARGDPEFVRLLTANGALPNAFDGVDKPPLYYAVQARSFELCRVLLAAGANPNQPVHSDERDALGRRLPVPIWQLAKDPKLIELLKAHGAR